MRVSRKEMTTALTDNPNARLYDITASGKFTPVRGQMFSVDRPGKGDVAGPSPAMSEMMAFRGEDGDRLISYDSDETGNGRVLYTWKSDINGWVQS